MTHAIALLHLDTLSPAERAALLQRSESDLAPFVDKVKPIIAAVRAEGDGALVRFAKAFDGAEINGIAATLEDFERAHQTLEPEVLDAIQFAARNVRKFHEDQKPEEMWLHEISPGAFAGDRTTAIPSVACYIPRGKGSFPSSVIMTCVPASVAGVEQVCIITPPGPDGSIDAATLVAARAAGVSRVYKCGGAQGIAAVAYGTETIPKCAKVVGPGSPWVVAAKQLCANAIDTGTPAGPSEAIIFADSSVDGRLAALDLLIEAEHGADSSAWLVTSDAELAKAARAAIPELWKEMSETRVAYTREVFKGARGGILLCPDAASAIAFINDYAPEHLQILSTEPFAWLGRFKHAGEILLGPHTPSTLGNFVIGPSHVLPTGGWARTYSALSVHDFMKRTSIAYVTREGYPALAKHAKVFAQYEGFDAHANAVGPMRMRFTRN